MQALLEACRRRGARVCGEACDGPAFGGADLPGLVKVREIDAS